MPYDSLLICYGILQIPSKHLLLGVYQYSRIVTLTSASVLSGLSEDRDFADDVVDGFVHCDVCSF